MTREELKRLAEKELIAYLKGSAFALCPASKEYWKEHIEETLNRIAELEKECGKLEGKVQDWTSEYYELENLMNNKVAKAKEDAYEMKSRFLELCNLKDMRIKELEKANEYAKTIIKDLLDNSDEYARQRAMDFLEEVENEAD